MARMGAVRSTAPAIAVLSVALLLGGQASAAIVRISLSGDSSAPSAPQATTSYAGDLSPGFEKSGRLLDNNLGLVAGQALTRVLDQISGIGWQLREAAGENPAQGDSKELSIPDGIDFAAESAQASDFDQEDPTEELAAAQEIADLSAPLEQETDENSAAFQIGDDPKEEDMDSDRSPGQLLDRVERLLRWLKGCPHGAMSRTASQMQLPESEQLQVTGSSEQMPPRAEALPQQMSIVRPLRITMFLNGVLAGALLPEQAQQAPLMMQEDGLIRPQKSANLLQSMAAAQAAARSAAQDAPAHVSPQVLVSQDSMLPQSIAAFLQQLPQGLFGGSMTAQHSAQLPQAQSLDPEWASIMPANALASIPGQNGATVVLTNARPQAQDMQGQNGAGEESDAVQQAEAASSGAAQSGFPSREAAAQAGAELAQRLGLSPDQALDKIVSTVLQQGWGVRREWATEDEGSEAEDSLTDTDTLSAAQDDQDADNINRDEVLAVPPQAGPDKREGVLHRMVSFFDQTLGRAARVLGVKQEPEEEAVEGVEGPVALATAAGRGAAEDLPKRAQSSVALLKSSVWEPAEVKAYTGEQSRVVEGVSADSYHVEPDLVADYVPQRTEGDLAMPPMSANAHNNAGAMPKAVLVPAPDWEAPQPPVRPAQGSATDGPAGPMPSRASANAHNNGAGDLLP